VFHGEHLRIEERELEAGRAELTAGIRPRLWRQRWGLGCAGLDFMASS